MSGLFEKYKPSLALPVSLDNRVHKLTLYSLVIVFMIVFGFPLYWMIVSGLKPLSDITTFPPHLVPQSLTLHNYARLFGESRYLTWLSNSLIVSSLNIAISVSVATLAGYSLTRFSIPYKQHIARLFIVTYMFPPIMLGIPYYILFLELGLLNTRLALVLALTAKTVPFTTWLMWQFFQTVPIEWEEAAWICGSSRTKALFEVALPGAIPGIVASSIFAFAIAWNDYTFALLLLSDPSKKVLTVGLNTFIAGDQIFWGMLMSGATLLVLPPILIIFFLNRYILAGFNMSSL